MAHARPPFALIALTAWALAAPQAFVQGPASAEPSSPATASGEQEGRNSGQKDAAHAAFEAGLKAFQSGKMEQAAQSLGQALQGGLPSRQIAKALYYRGVAFRKQGKPAQAISDLTSALWLKGGLDERERAEATENRAAAYREAGLGEAGPPPAAHAVPADPIAPPARTSNPAATPAARTASGSTPPSDSVWSPPRAAPPAAAPPARAANAATPPSEPVWTPPRAAPPGASPPVEAQASGPVWSPPRASPPANAAAATVATAEPSPIAEAPARSSAAASAPPAAWRTATMNAPSAAPPSAPVREAGRVAAVPAAAPQETAAIPPAGPEPTGSDSALGGFFKNLFGSKQTASDGSPSPTASEAGPKAAGWTETTTAAPHREVRMAALAPVAAAPPPAVIGTSAEARPEPAAMERPGSPAAPIAEPIPGATAYRLQVAAVRSRREADDLAARLRSEHGPKLGPRLPVIDEAVFGNMGTFYRVRLGPYAEAGEPRRLCAALNASGFDCLVIGQ